MDVIFYGNVLNCNETGLMMTGGFYTKLKDGDKAEVLPFANAG